MEAQPAQQALSRDANASRFVSALLVVAAARVFRVAFKAWQHLDDFRLQSVAGVCGLYVIALALVVLALYGVGERLSLPPAVRRLLATKAMGYAAMAATILVLSRHLVQSLTGTHLASDGALFAQFSVESLLAGHNPYAVSMQGAFAAHHVDIIPTYRIDGTAVLELSYPAMSFLAFVPQVLLGLTNLDLTSLVALLVTMLWLIKQSPAELKWLPLLLLWANWDIVAFSSGGVFDILWVLPTLLSMQALATSRPAAAGALYGLACAVKQTPWFIAPFVLFSLWMDAKEHPQRTRSIVRFVGPAVASFVAINLPFIIADGTAWLKGVLTPVVGGVPLVELGCGPVLFDIAGLTQQPRTFFALLTLLGLMVLSVAYALWYGRLKWLAWSAPILVLWLNYRSPQNYYVFFLMTAYLGVILKFRQTRTTEVQRHGLPWFAGTVAASLVIAVVGARTLSAKVFLNAEIRIGALRDTDALLRVSEMDVEVRNLEERPITPSFGIVHSSRPTPVYWDVIEGPERIQPGQDTLYRLAAPRASATIPLQGSVRVSVFDHGTERRASAFHDGGRHSRTASLANPTFARWVSDEFEHETPFLWRPDGFHPSAQATRFDAQTGAGLRLQTATRTIAMHQMIEAAPSTIVIDATPVTLVDTDTALAAQPSTGVEIDAGSLCLKLVFADAAKPSEAVGSCHVVYLPGEPGRRFRNETSMAQIVDSKLAAELAATRGPVRVAAFATASPHSTIAPEVVFHELAVRGSDVSRP